MFTNELIWCFKAITHNTFLILIMKFMVCRFLKFRWLSTCMELSILIINFPLEVKLLVIQLFLDTCQQIDIQEKLVKLQQQDWKNTDRKKNREKKETENSFFLWLQSSWGIKYLPVLRDLPGDSIDTVIYKAPKVWKLINIFNKFKMIYDI